MPVSRLFPWRIVWGRPTYLPASALRYWTTESGSENQQTCMHTDTKKLLRICHIRPSDLNIETRPFVKYVRPHSHSDSCNAIYAYAAAARALANWHRLRGGRAGALYGNGG